MIALLKKYCSWNDILFKVLADEILVSLGGGNLNEQGLSHNLQQLW